ncbi:MAG: phosphoserine phosphatase [Polyangia bacterium]
MNPRHAYQVVPREGERRSGDAVFVRVTEACSLFALIDALGHGDTAARVAQRALDCLERLPVGIEVTGAMEALHAELHGTRGAAITLCSLRGMEAELLGIGNVTCRTLGAPMPFVPRPGIVGRGSRVHGALRLPLARGQRLLFHSDGVSHRFDLRTISELGPEEACAFILRHHRYPHDDASVLVIDAHAATEGAR